MSKCKLGLDPRTKALFFIAVVFIVFFLPLHEEIHLALMAILLLLFLAEGLYRSTLEIIVTYGLLLLLQYSVLPIVPRGAAMFLSMFVYFRVIFPCALPLMYLFKTTNVREIMVAMGKMKLPESFIVAFAIMVRYLPVVKEEIATIRKAMSLRTIKGWEQRLECLYVPMLMETVQTADELSQAAITRGIDHPGVKTSYVEVAFGKSDVIAWCITCLALIGGFLYGRV